MRYILTIVSVVLVFISHALAGLRIGDDGWTVIEPSADTRIVYVSNSQGSDTNDGLSEATPVQTIEKGKLLLRNGFPDWLLLKKGDVWTNESLGYWQLSGRSEQERILIGAYGTGNRPLLKPAAGQHGIKTTVGFSNVAIVGIEFYAFTRDPNNPGFIGTAKTAGIKYIDFEQSHQNLLVEDVTIRMFGGGVGVESIGSTPFVNFQLRRSVIVDSYATGSHSGGMFLVGVDGILIEGNLFDHNGWYDDRDTGGVIGAKATIFNHNVYIDNENPTTPTTRDERDHIIVRGNVFTRAASHGIQLRPGGTIDNNLFVRNPLPILLGGGTNYEMHTPDGVDGEVGNNVVLEANDINSSLPRGYAIEFTNIRSGDLTSNIVAHNVSSPTNAWGMVIIGTTNNPSRNINIRDNTWYDWRRGAIKLNGQDYITIETEENNRYWDATTAGWPVIGTNQNSEDLVFVDPNRSVASYNATLGGAASFEAFIAEVRQQSKDNWRKEYTAAAVNDYIQAGFAINRPPVIAGTLDDIKVTLGSQVDSIELGDKFVDPDGNALIYTVVANDNPAAVTAAINEQCLILHYHQVGATIITLRATDPASEFAQRAFTVTVVEPPTIERVEIIVNLHLSDGTVLSETFSPK